MSQSSIEYSEELLANLGWLRQLAEKLAGDRQLAEDLAQTTCLQALENRPRDASRLREWLASILRNCFLQEHRRRKTRQARELGSARPESQASTAYVVSKASAQKALVAAVLALAEPYRSTLLLRFFEELPPRRIAERTGVSVATVNSRLSRGLDRLRRELDRSHRGGREEWLSAFAVLIAGPVGFAALGTIMNSKLKFALASSLVIGLWAIGYQVLPAEDLSPAAASASIGDSSAILESEPASDAGDILLPREDLPRLAIDRAGAEAPLTELVRGRVFDPEGLALPNIPVLVAGSSIGEERAVSDAAGEFALTTRGRAVSILSNSPEHVTVFSAEHAPDSPIRPAIVVAEKLRLGGLVVDADGLPLANVKLEVVYPQGFEARLGIPLDRSRRSSFRSVSNSEGRFELPAAPSISAASLRAQLEPFAPAAANLPTHSEQNMYLVMQREEVGEEKIQGRVLDAIGQPVADARVSLGMTSSLSDADGVFELGLKRAANGERILAVKQGMLPGSYELLPAGDASAVAWPAWVEIRLGEKPLSISGRVLDAQGQPLAGAMLWIDDPSAFGLVGLLPVKVEGLMAGAPVGNSPDLPAEVLDNPRQGEHVYSIMDHAREPSASWHYVLADEDGSFTFPGLMERAYQLRAMHPETLHSVSKSVVAGSRGVVLELPAEKGLKPIAGVLVDEDGHAVAGATISQIRRVLHAQQRVPGGQLDGSLIRHGPRTKSDAQGRFRFDPSSDEDIMLSIFGDGILPLIPDLKDAADWKHLRYELQRRYHFEVVVAPEIADAIEARGADGEQMVMAQLRSGSSSMDGRRPLAAGRSGVLAVSGKVRSILLLKAGVIVQEIPVSLRPGQTNLIRH